MRRQAFVAAGAAAIDKFGPDTSAEQIAATAGVSRTVLYRYFRDREDLRQAIAAQITEELVARVVSGLQIGPSTTPRQIIDGTLGKLVGWLEGHPHQYQFLRARRSGQALEHIESSIADQLAGLLKAFIMYFGVPTEQAEPAAYAMVGMVESASLWWASNPGVPRERFLKIMGENLWYVIDGGVRARGGTIDRDAPLPIGLSALPDSSADQTGPERPSA